MARRNGSSAKALAACRLYGAVLVIAKLGGWRGYAPSDADRTAAVGTAVPRSAPTRSMVSMAIEFPCPFVIRRPLRPSFDAGHRACRRGELDASSARARQEGRPCAPAGRAS